MNRLLLLALSALLVSVQGRSFSTDLEGEWALFKDTHGKTYDNEAEELMRMQIFADNHKKIAEHNALFEQGKSSFALKMNEFGDMIPEEFLRMMNGYRPSSVSNGTSFIVPDDDIEIPESMDWREKGAVTSVMNQGHCGSCWAFSATGSLEGQHFRKTGKLLSLSEQNLVDCSRSYGNHGCLGGLMDRAFRYIKQNGGIDTEESYPYEARDLRCRFKKSKIGATDSGFVDIKGGDEEALKKAVATVGPISVAIDAGHSTFMFYHHGVYDNPSCSSTILDHGVLAVGYGRCHCGKDYWLVKNSWGAKWGMDGYIRMSRNKQNQCGIASKASYPLV